jgi:small-conductance mechanosensitive channel
MNSSPFADVLARTFLGNSVRAWIVAAITATVVFFALLALRALLMSRIGKLAERTTNRFDDMAVGLLHETRPWVLAVLSIAAALHALVLGRAGPYVAQLSHLVLLWQLALWGVTAVTFWTRYHLERRTASHDRASVAMISAMSVGAKILVWALIGTTALYTVFQINPASLITTLGVSGIAVALAVQNILGDLLAALAIVFDKPFDVGDFIGVDNIVGTVEHIGLKTTRLRSLSGEQVIIGNGDLLKSRLRNYRRMTQRRIVFGLDVPYDTPPDVLAEIPRLIETIIRAQSPVKFDRSHVASFAESSIHVESVYIVLDPDYNKYMDIQQAIDLAILREFNARNIEFALPARTLFHQGPEPDSLGAGTPVTAA